METAISLSSKIVVTSTNVVKFFVPRVLYDPRIAIKNSARIVTFFLPTRVVNLSSKYLQYYVTLITSVLSIVDQVQLLEKQIRELKETSVENQEKYTRARFVNFSLTTRILSLKQQIIDLEVEYKERLQQERSRSEDLEYRQKVQLEDANSRLQQYEAHSTEREEELARQKIIIDRIENERQQLMKRVQELTEEIISTKNEANISKEQEKRTSEECKTKTELIEKLLDEIEKLRTGVMTPVTSSTLNDCVSMEELYNELWLLKEKNFVLEDANEDLQASLLLTGIKQRQFLATHENKITTDMENMTNDEIQKALNEEQRLNSQLKTYIDGILLKIVDNYPQLLEVKTMSQTI